MVAGATLAHWAEIDLLHVPYKSAPPAITDLLAGRVSMMFNDFTTSLPHVQAKTLRRAGVDAHQAQRAVPGAAHHGRGRRDRLRHGLLGRHLRAGQDAAGRSSTQLNTELRKIIDSDEVKSKLRNAGFEAFSSSPQELDDFVKVQLGKWGKMVKDAGIQPE